MPQPPTAAPLPELLAQLADAVDDLAPSLAAEVAQLRERLAGGRFLLTVVGEFNRGKSTLINALVGREVLPMGAIPVTTVTTTLAHGPDGLVVHLQDGSSRQGELAELDRLVTESGNPGNRDAIDRVEVTIGSPLLAPGVVVIDTPGFASRHEHNTATASQALERTDAAILVLSAVQPVSERDLALLGELDEVSVRTLVVVNRIDAVPEAERGQVESFIADTLAEHGVAPDRLHAVSAADALSAQLAGQPLPETFAELLAELDRTLQADLDLLRDRAERRRVRALADRLASTLELERAAAALSSAELTERLATFDEVVAEQRRRFDEDRAVIDQALTTIADAAYEQLLDEVREPAREDLDRLRQAATEAGLRELRHHLDARIDELVRRRYDDLRRATADDVARRWQQAAQRYLGRVTARSDELAEAASELFDVPLVPPSPPGFTSQPSGFYHATAPSATMTGELAAPLRLLLPASVQRHRAVERADERYREGLVKHAGRVRWDVLQRLTSARDELVEATRGHLDRVADDVQRAARRAEQRRAEAAEEQRRWGSAAERAAAVIEAVRAATGQA